MSEPRMMNGRVAMAVAIVLLSGLTASEGTVCAQDKPGSSPPGGQATTVQLPTFGISIDAAGVVALKSVADPQGRLRAQRVAAAKQQLPADLTRFSPLRKVSLVRLERALREKRNAGQQPDQAMLHLAGLQRVQYVFVYPDLSDVVIAGPAEGFVADGVGRAVGIGSGRPVVLLEDLLVALRAYPPGTNHRPFIGCTIDPDPQGLARLQQFQRTIPRSIPNAQRNRVAATVAQGTRNSLGMANIRVFGVSDRTHLAQVLIEADYRMKLIGIGLEPPPIRMTTFASALTGAPRSTLQRWWFTPNYQAVRTTDDGLAMRLEGQGVQLQGEEKQIGAQGGLTDSGRQPSKASRLYTLSFTRQYEQIATASPAFAQLRNMIDVLVAAAWMRQQDAYGRTGWSAAALQDERLLPTQVHANPRQVQCAVNVFWKRNRLLAPAGGGVSIAADKALDADTLMKDDDGQVTAQWGAEADRPDQGWWWD